jgi:7-cyano-7-deazaguanine synthase
MMNAQEDVCHAIVLHSGGMDSSICLALAAREYGPSHVLSLGFNYHQRHTVELQAAEKIAADLGIRRKVIQVEPLPGWESSSLVNRQIAVRHEGSIPNSFVLGRNGLFLMMTTPLIASLNARAVYAGVMEIEGHYPDCSRKYIELVQSVMRIDLQNPEFVIQTPLISMTKMQTMELANSLNILDYLLEHTISCYEGIARLGCTKCPACRLRNNAIRQFYTSHPHLTLPKFLHELSL